MNTEQIKESVKTGYAKIANRSKKKSFLPAFLQCCGSKSFVEEVSKKIGYNEEELKIAPEGSNLGIGCGNPTALASIKKGETVLDLGSGAGFDCFLASRETGETGKVIGVDITPEMVEKARHNAIKSGYKNIEFKVGEIENLPIENNSVDLIISNCVINLSNQKEQVFREAFRVLKPKGRIMISDIVLLQELPEFIKRSVEGYIACLSGAVTKGDYLSAITNAGFSSISIDKEAPFPIELMLTDPIAQKIIADNNLTEQATKEIANSIASISVSAIKQ